MVVTELQERDARRFLENLEDALARARPGDPLPGLGAIDGTDATGTVYCVVDLGGTLSQVGIVDGWWTEVGPNGVAAAILQALRFARDKATLARMLLDRHRFPYDMSAPFARLPPLELPPYEDPSFVDALWRKVNRAASVLADAARFAEERDSGRRREVTGPRGLFRVMLSGFTVVGALVNEQGLRPSDGTELAADARDALMAVRHERGI